LESRDLAVVLLNVLFVETATFLLREAVAAGRLRVDETFLVLEAGLLFATLVRGFREAFAVVFFVVRKEALPLRETVFLEDFVVFVIFLAELRFATRVIH